MPIGPPRPGLLPSVSEIDRIPTVVLEHHPGGPLMGLTRMLAATQMGTSPNPLWAGDAVRRADSPASVETFG